MSEKLRSVQGNWWQMPIQNRYCVTYLPRSPVPNNAKSSRLSEHFLSDTKELMSHCVECLRPSGYVEEEEEEGAFTSESITTSVM